MRFSAPIASIGDSNDGRLTFEIAWGVALTPQGLPSLRQGPVVFPFRPRFQEKQRRLVMQLSA